MEETNQIISFIKNYIPLSEAEARIINESKFIVEYKKGDTLLRASEYAKKCFFILKGCVRAYYLIDGEERSTEFFVENDTIVPVSYRTKMPSEYYLTCLEDCIITAASGEQSEALLRKVPRLKELVTRLNETLLVRKQIMMDDFRNLSVEERYLKLQETRPDLIHRIPQYHLATFIGITPVSLSRLRKRLSKK